MKKLTLIAALFFGTAFYASAQTVTPIGKTQVQQTKRIKQGVRSGELTRREAKALKRQQRDIQRDKRLARADGVVTKRERAHIRHEQQVANRSIYRQKHDLQSR